MPRVKKVSVDENSDHDAPSDAQETILGVLEAEQGSDTLPPILSSPSFERDGYALCFKCHKPTRQEPVILGTDDRGLKPADRRIMQVVPVYHSDCV